MEGAPPARQRALNTRGDPRVARIDTSIFLSMAATQPVDGAALIRRYRSVQLRGGQPGRIPSGLYPAERVKVHAGSTPVAPTPPWSNGMIHAF
jgi:hypothetical protein